MNIIPKFLTATALAVLVTTSAPALTLTVTNGALNTPIVFYGTYGMAAEARIPDIEAPFDFNAFFARLASVSPGQRRINGVRVWLHYHWANALTLFNGLPASATDTDRRKRYDFTLSARYLDRLERFVAAANARNIAVQLCLFDGVMLETSSPLRWNNSPYNARNNRDPRALTNPADFFKTEGGIWDVNRGLIDAVTARLGHYPNVIWEVSNEPGISDTGASPGAVLAFHKAVVAQLRTRLSNSAGSKLISVNADTAGLRAWAANSPEVDILSVHLSENVDLGTHSFRQYLGRKPVIISNDGHTSCFANLDTPTRARMARQLVNRVFAADGPGREGRLHVEFLDNGLVGGHGSPDYDPRAGLVRPDVLNALKRR